MHEAAKNIFRFPVPLPGSPLKELNCYIVKGEKRHLLIDTGFNTGEGLAAVKGAFKELGISPADADIFLTHLHADHTGLVEVLKGECGSIFMNETDSVHVNRNFIDEYWIEFMGIQDHMGFPDGQTLNYKDHPAYRGGVKTHTDFEFVSEGMDFSYGGYSFKAIDLRGHTPGQTGLYDRESGILFCGDHILNKITPNINLWDFEDDYLALFLENLRKVKSMDVKVLLTAHRAPVDDIKARIDGLLLHHDRRLSAVMSALANGRTTVYGVAMDIGWDYGGGFFGNFPAAQKWFAASEVFAHLENLRRSGKIDLTKDGLTYNYTVR
jgi:glyoxylase-like metal-dependent hydrolase (beta-lactamase superfamily II)